MARVFISHSSRDVEPAARIKAWLQEQGFETPFLDFDKHAGIPPGADWEKTLYREIEQSEAIVIIQTPNWMDSKWCFAEYTQARAFGKAIFPVIEAPTGETLIASDIQALNLLQDREGGLEQLSRELTRIALDAQGGFAWDSSRPPYPGLSAFQEEDAAIYFGRDDAIRRLIERLNARRAQGGAKIIALLGASGSGKSSLLRAGVIPRIKRDKQNWIVLPSMRPQTHPVDELARVIAVALKQGPDWRAWRDELNGADLARTLRDLAGDLRMQTDANEAQLLVLVDQAEELFGASDPAEANQFFEILNAAAAEDLPFLTVLAQRSDFLEKLQSAEKLTARFEECSLGPLPLARIPQIIEGPARVAGLGIDDGLILQASKDAETEDALPLLAFALRELFDRYADDNRLTLENYHALGDAKEDLTPLENAVRKAAADVLANADPDADELTALRDAFVPAMVRVNDKGEYVRCPALLDDLPQKAHKLLNSLAEARLLVIGQEGDKPTVEVAHEALLRKWPRLRNWLDDAREFLTGKQQMERDLHDWEQAAPAEKPHALLTGLKLARAENWLAERGQHLTGDEINFIQASVARIRAQERRRTRTRWLITGGSLVSACLLAALAILGRQQAELARNEADRALDLVRISQAAEWQAQDASQAGLLLAELKDPDTDLARRRMGELLTLPLVSAELFHDGLVELAQFSPSGDLLVTLAGADGQYGFEATQARVWQASTGRALTVPLVHPQGIQRAAISADNSSILTVTDRTIRVWDLETEKTVWQKELIDPASNAIFVGRRPAIAVAIGSSLWLHDARTGDELNPQPWQFGSEIRKITAVPGHNLIAVALKNSNVSVRDITSGTVKDIEFESVYDIEWNSDASLLGIASDAGLSIWNVENDSTRVAEFDDRFRDLYFSSDGNDAVFEAAPRTSGEIRITSARRFSNLHLLHANSLAVNYSRGVIRLLSGTGTTQGFGTHSIYGSDRVPTTLSTVIPRSRIAASSARLEIADILFRGAFSPDGKTMATISGTPFGSGRLESLRPDNFVRLWNVETLRERTARRIAGIAPQFDISGEHLLTIKNNLVHVQRTDDGSLHAIGPIEHPKPVKSAAFHPDGRRLATLAGDTITIHLLTGDAGDGSPQQFNAPSAGFVQFSGDGSLLAALKPRWLIGSLPETVGLWNVKTGEDMLPPEISQCEDQTAHIDLSGRLLASFCDGKISFWLRDGGVFSAVETPIPRPFSRLARVSADAELIALEQDAAVELWDIHTGELSMSHPIDEDEAHSLAFQSGGRLLAIGTRTGKVHILDTVNKVAQNLESGPTGMEIGRVEFTPDGKYLIATYSSFNQDGILRIWKSGDASLVGDMPIPGVWKIVGDGDSILTWSGREARLWSIETAEPLFDATFDHPWASKTASWMDTGDIAGGTVSSDGSYFATYSDKGTYVWRIGGRDLQQTLENTVSGCLSSQFRQTVLAEDAEQAQQNVEACRERKSRLFDEAAPSE